MTRFFGREILKKVNKVDSQTVSMDPGAQLRLGGRLEIFDSVVQLDTGISGIGGLDVGSVAQETFYYVYAVRSGSTLGLVASLNANGPQGFLRYRKVGGFTTGVLSADVQTVVNYGGQDPKVIFRIGNSGSTPLTGTAETDIVLNNKDGTINDSFDLNDAYNTSTGVYTVPHDGFYNLSFEGVLGNAVRERYTIRIKDAGTGDLLGRGDNTAESGETVLATASLNLSKGQQVKVTTESQTDASYNYQQSTRFEGYRVPTVNEIIDWTL